MVTEESAEDDVEVYGDAWPLVEGVAGAADRPSHTRAESLSWLVTEERLLTLELAMLDDHGLTLPPEIAAPAWIRTKGPDQLAPYRVERYAGRRWRRRKRLRWVRRILTVGLWWK